MTMQIKQIGAGLLSGYDENLHVEPEQNKTESADKTKLETNKINFPALASARYFEQEANRSIDQKDKLRYRDLSQKMFVKAALKNEIEAIKWLSNIQKQGAIFYPAFQALMNLALGEDEKEAKASLLALASSGDLEAIQAMYDPDVSEKLTKLGLNSVEYADKKLEEEITKCKSKKIRDMDRGKVWLSKVFLQMDKKVILPKSYEAKRFKVLTLISKTLTFHDFWVLFARTEQPELDQLRDVIKSQIKHILGDKSMEIQFQSFPALREYETFIFLKEDISSTNSSLNTFFKKIYYWRQTQMNNCLVINEENFKAFQNLMDENLVCTQAKT